MTEYITYEEAEKIAEDSGLDDCQPHWASTEQYIRAIQRAINLFCEQSLEVVGYTTKHETDAVRDGADHAYIWPDEASRGAPSIPLYTLKGDSK
jgi:hypothetical protein